MTEQEAIEELKYDCNELGKAIPCDTGWGMNINEAYSMAIKALKEIRQYRAIGTPEECQAAAEKQKPMKVTDIHVDEYHCPACWAENCTSDACTVGDQYCPNCGQRLGESKNDER